MFTNIIAQNNDATHIKNPWLCEIISYIQRNQLRDSIKYNIKKDNNLMFELETTWCHMPWLIPNLKPFTNDIKNDNMICNIISPCNVSDSILNLHCANGYSVSNLYNNQVRPINAKSPEPFIISFQTKGQPYTDRAAIILQSNLPCRFITGYHHNNSNADEITPAPIIYWGPLSMPEMISALWSHDETWQAFTRRAMQVATSIDMKKTRNHIKIISEWMMGTPIINDYINKLCLILDQIRPLKINERPDAVKKYLKEYYTTKECDIAQLHSFAVDHLLPTFVDMTEPGISVYDFVRSHFIKHGQEILSRAYYSQRYQSSV